MELELDKEFIIDTVAAYRYELAAIGEVLADPHARKHVNQDKLRSRQNRLREMIQTLANCKLPIAAEQEEIIHDIRTGYGDRNRGVYDLQRS